jgi:hypothetical protein
MPDQFWSLTVREFWIKFDGFHRAENRALWLNAHHARLTQRYKPHPRTPDQLLGYGGAMYRYPLKSWLRKPS